MTGVRLFLCRVLSLGSFLKYWLPVLGLMALIFVASGDRMSFDHSSRFIGPLVRWLFPHLTPRQLHQVHVYARKGAHVTEYALLAVLVWRGFRGSLGEIRAPWKWSHAAATLGVVIAYASLDEWHQAFIPSRQGSVADVAIDTAGACVALALAWVVVRWRQRPQPPP